MCSLHKGGRVHGCPACYGSTPDFLEITNYADAKVKYLKDRQRYSTDPFIDFRPMRSIEAPAPEPPPPPPLDPMIVLADLADEIDKARRIFRLGMMEMALVFLVAAFGMSVMMVGLFLIGPLFWVGLPFVIAGVGYCPASIASAQRKYLAIYEARAEFARAQRRVGQ